MVEGRGAAVAAVEAARIASRLGVGPGTEWDALDRAVLLDPDAWDAEVVAALGDRVRGELGRDLLRL